VAMQEIADRLDARPTESRLPEQRPGRFGESIGLAATAAPELHRGLAGKFPDRVPDRQRIDGVRETVIMGGGVRADPNLTRRRDEPAAPVAEAVKAIPRDPGLQGHVDFAISNHLHQRTFAVSLSVRFVAVPVVSRRIEVCVVRYLQRNASILDRSISSIAGPARTILGVRQVTVRRHLNRDAGIFARSETAIAGPSAAIAFCTRMLGHPGGATLTECAVWYGYEKW